jgi:tRNA/rRNA methyltransferase
MLARVSEIEQQGLDAGRVRFVLVQPRSAGNAGAAARALKNLGFHRLVLDRPGFAVDDPEAQRMAVDARDVLAAARVCDGLDEALDGARTVVGTTGRRGKHRRPHWRLDRFGAELDRMWAAGEIALVFGREDSGLNDSELDRCTHLVYLPSSDEYPSFNLAQAVLLLAWELRRPTLGPPAEPLLEPPSDHASREEMYRHLQEAWLTIGFLHRDSVETIMRRMRRLFGRANLSSRETKLLRGVARQTLWAAGLAGLRAERASRRGVPPPEDDAQE